MKKYFAVIFIILISLSCFAGKKLILATTTSTVNTGLLDFLKPKFEERYGYELNILSVGTGQALKLGEDGNADVLLVHAPDAEQVFMQNGNGVARVTVMYNDFVFVGSKTLKNDKIISAKEFLEFIFENKIPFISRGDNSGTNMKEIEIWDTTDLEYEGQPWYIKTGQGMGNTLIIGDEKKGTVLTDRGTYYAYKDRLDMDIIFEGDPILLNLYSVIVVDPSKSPLINYSGALDFLRFMMDENTLEEIAGYEKNGYTLFTPLIKTK